MTLTRYGFREWGSALAVTIIIIAGCVWMLRKGTYPTAAWIIIGVATVLFLSFAAFFRNPHRNVPRNPLLITSPADGTIRDITEVDDFDIPPFKGKALRIGIFLSVFNVHVNRTPCEIAVENVNYREGEYLDARDGEAAKRNEAMTISGTGFAGEKTFPVAVRQISGAIARRIVCPVKPGKRFAKGYIYGMIKFGSRTELYLPAGQFELAVKVGDKVRGGESILATLTE